MNLISLICGNVAYPAFLCLLLILSPSIHESKIFDLAKERLFEYTDVHVDTSSVFINDGLDLPIPQHQVDLYSQQTDQYGFVSIAANTDRSDDVHSQSFDPYVDNGGSLMGIAGKDFVVLAGDTRLSDGYSIKSRNISRIFNIMEDSPNIQRYHSSCPIFFAGCGCYSDILELSKILRIKTAEYEWQTSRKLKLSASAIMLSNQLYSRRFFPYYSFSCMAGMDDDGFGALYQYDAVGSFERCKTICLGKGETLLRPFLDGLTNINDDGQALWTDKGLFDNPGLYFESTDPSSKFVGESITAEEAVTIIKRAFESAAEREISVGDGLTVLVTKRIAKSSDMTESTDARNLYETKTYQYHLPSH